MAKDYKKLISRFLELYKTEELAAILKVSTRSIANYKEGGNPSWDTQRDIEALSIKLAENNWQAIPIEELVRTPDAGEISADTVLLKVLLQEFAEYKAEKEGLDPKKVAKDIENKARLILDVSNRL